MPLTELQASRRQAALGALVGLGCGLLVGAVFLFGAFDAFDLRLLDWKFRLRGERDASHSVAIVPIDDATIRAYGGWPIPRDQYALLLTVLGQSGARAIGVDLQLPEDVNHDPRHNTLLAYVSGRESKVVHAISFMPEAPTAPGGPAIPASSLEALRRHGVPDTTVNVPVASGLAMPFEDLARSASALGHITVVTDRDGAVRRQPFLIRYEDRVYPSMAMRLMGVGSGRAGPPRPWRLGRQVHAGWTEGPEWTLPLDREGATSLDFAGDRGAFTSSISMVEVLRAYQKGEQARLRETLADRYVLVGLDSRTEVSEDVGTTPFAATTPLLYVHANAVENLLRHRFLTRPAAPLYLGALGILAAALGWLFGMLPLAAAALAAGLAVLVLGALDL
ncbi:MAG TPA: CHASE2 domain-containing protein, partial [Candidatus Saccharimonadales bacterium]|nr:CHASE2 domain-containing protein [Candidatus Saccharimonadales bacterium]